MHEAQQDAEESGSTGISGILTIVVFFGIIYIINALFSSKKSENNLTQEHDEFDNYLYLEEIEKAGEIAEKEMMDLVNKDDALSDVDIPPMPISNKDYLNHEKEEEKYVEEFIKKQEDKFFPEGSIEERLKDVSRNSVVDLGLSVKWSNKNIGANKIYDIGYKFRWGTIDYIENFDRGKLSEYYEIPFEKEIDEYMQDISGNEDLDAANKFSGGMLRIPTKAECEELLQRCKWDYVEVDKYKGFIITGPSGASIFLPVSYSSFVNCMDIIMLSVEEAYMTSTPAVEKLPEVTRVAFGEGGCSYRMSIVNNNHATESFTKRIVSFSKKHRFSPIRGVCK